MGESLYPLFILASIIALLGYWVSPNDSNYNPNRTNQSSNIAYRKVVVYGFGIVEIPSKFNLKENMCDEVLHSYSASLEKNGVDITFSSINFSGSNSYEDFRYNPRWSINSTDVQVFIGAV